MSDKPKTIYCGNGRIISSQNGLFRSVSICLDDIPEEFITKSEKNGKRYVSININDKEQKDQYGKDVSVSVDQWKPDPNYKKGSQNTETPPPVRSGQYDQTPQEDDKDLPF